MRYGRVYRTRTLRTEYWESCRTWGAVELSGRFAKIILLDGSDKNLYRNSGEGAACDDTVSDIMILPERGF